MYRPREAAFSHNFPPQATLLFEKFSLGLSLDKLHLDKAPLQLIRNAVCSQELVLCNEHLVFNKQPYKLFFLPE